MKQKNTIHEILRNFKATEDKKTQIIFELTDTIKKQRFINKEQAIKILCWKSPRPLKHYAKNSDEDFINTTKLAFEQENEKLKIHILTSLYGVKIPAASALLLFYNRLKYPVIDIRVWKLLFKYGYLDDNPNGQNFTLDQWDKYLFVIRKLAYENNLSVREVEKTLFEYDKMNQKGRLYKNK